MSGWFLIELVEPASMIWFLKLWLKLFIIQNIKSKRFSNLWAKRGDSLLLFMFALAVGCDGGTWRDSLSRDNNKLLYRVPSPTGWCTFTLLDNQIPPLHVWNGSIKLPNLTSRIIYMCRPNWIPWSGSSHIIHEFWNKRVTNWEIMVYEKFYW